MFFENFLNLDLFTVGLAIAAIGILGFTIYFSNKKSITNKTFVLMAVSVFFWSIFNYLSYQVHSAELALWFLRAEIYFAVWHAFFNFQLFYVFPQEKKDFSKLYKYCLLPIAIIVSFLNLSPLVFNHVVSLTPTGRINEVANGPGIVIFSTFVLLLLAAALFQLIKKLIQATANEKSTFWLMLIGAIITLSLLIIFNLLLPAYFNNSDYISWGALFMLPFVFFSGYAIAKNRLLNIKILSTEILIFLLSISSLFEILTSENLSYTILRFSIFLAILSAGILLIKSVFNEVRQREQLEILTKQLEDANKQLKILDQARAEFITIASHQLRTPPATIKWYLSSILNGDYGRVTKELKLIIGKANLTNNSLISLIDDLLNVSRIERGKMEFLFEPCNLTDLARFTYEQLLPIAQDKHLELVFNEPKIKLPEIMADKEKIRQVMNNLIDNAIKYTHDGKITVGISADSANIRFSVTDTGKGISPDEKDSIFEKYSRGKESVNKSPGLGLGLYVAKIVIGQHKGKIWAESPGSGKGSSFIFEIPIHNNLEKTTLLNLADK